MRLPDRKIQKFVASASHARVAMALRLIVVVACSFWLAVSSTESALAYTMCSPGNTFGTETCGPGTINQGVSYNATGPLTLNIQSGTTINAQANESGVLMTGSSASVTVNAVQNVQINSPQLFGIWVGGVPGGSPTAIGSATVFSNAQITAGREGIEADGTLSATVVNNGAITVNGPTGSQNGYGIFAFANGPVAITNSGAITAVFPNNNGNVGISAASATGNVTVTNANSATITVTASGIDATGGGGQALTSVTNNGKIVSGVTGIFAASNEPFGGSTNVANGGTISAGGSGIDTRAGDTAAASNSGTINAENGVAVQAVNLATVTNSGTIIAQGLSGLSGPVNGTAIYATPFNFNAGTTFQAAIQISNAGQLSATNYGIWATTYGSINISNSGTVTGGTAGIHAAGLANGNSQAITINNASSGILGASSNLAIETAGSAPATINNAGIVNGFVILASPGNTFNNSGTFNALGDSTFGGAKDVFNNMSTLALTSASPGAVTFNSLGQFNNSGMIAMLTGRATDVLTIAGNFVAAPSSEIVLQVSPTSADKINVGGTAKLAGTMNTVFDFGSYTNKQYDILHSTGLAGVFSGLDTINLMPGFKAELSYSTTDVFLNLVAALGSGSGLNVNQQNVATSLNNFFNSGGTLPPAFLNIFGLTGGNLANTLSQLDGEVATGAERAAFDLTNEFLGLMLDPFVYGHRGEQSVGGRALGFAPDADASFPPDAALAYAGVLKAPPKAAASFDQRWTAWAASYGGRATFNGEPSIGSTNVTASAYGFAAGADYHAAPDTVLGFALAGAGTNWGLEQGLGSGRSDAFQAGVHGSKYFGPAYLGAALAFTNNWFTTNRAALGDSLTARFDGQSLGGRVEGGYRYAVQPTIGVIPYAAIQAQSFHTPAYSETDLTGGGFGLSYNAMTASDTRSELGARFDDLTACGAMPLQLRARLAWAHDWVANPALGAVFAALPGASFVVNGAPVPHNSALATAGADLHITPRWELIGKFDGEFASSAKTYAGSATLRYSW
jgi:hypothetical protein